MRVFCIEGLNDDVGVLVFGGVDGRDVEQVGALTGQPCAAKSDFLNLGPQPCAAPTTFHQPTQPKTSSSAHPLLASWASPFYQFPNLPPPGAHRHSTQQQQQQQQSCRRLQLLAPASASFTRTSSLASASPMRSRRHRTRPSCSTSPTRASRAASTRPPALHRGLRGSSLSTSKPMPSWACPLTWWACLVFLMVTNDVSFGFDD